MTNDSSEISLPVLFGNVVARANRNRHHCQRWILTTLRDETRPISYEQILDVPTLIELVEH